MTENAGQNQSESLTVEALNQRQGALSDAPYQIARIDGAGASTYCACHWPDPSLQQRSDKRAFFG